METEYLISESDCVKALRLYSKMTLKTALMFSIAVVILILIIIWGELGLKAIAIGALIGGVGGHLVVRFIIGPFVAKRHYRNYKAIHEPIHIRLQDEGIEFSTVDVSGIVKWNNIYKWRQNKRYILIYQAPRLYQVIPKSIHDKGFDISLLVQELQKHVGNEK